jgi:hypothetical protein
MHNDLIVIHYGSPIYDPNKIKPIRNQDLVKPIGGLWTSPVDSLFGWKDWCKGADFRECNEYNSFKLGINKDAKICIIDSHDDLIKLLNNSEYLDFEYLSLNYDAIHLTKKGQEKTHMTRHYNLYGWNCESILIMNKNCCYAI